MTVQKRFIAGAVCPRCGEMDRLVTYVTDEGHFKECVSCDFKEKQLVQVESSELPTRVNQIEEDEALEQEGVATIKIIDPSRMK